MIFDTLQNAALYENLKDGFAKGFAFIREAEEKSLPVGRYDIDGDKVYAMIQEYKTHENLGQFEAHRDYIDIQYIASGVEVMEYAPLADCTETVAYTPDIAFYHARAKVKMTFYAGDFGIFLPDDAHNPGVWENAAKAVRKIVIKVHI